MTFSTPVDLRAWRQQVGLAAELLFDADGAVAVAYGAAESQDQERPSRVSVLVDADGRVAKVYEVSDAVAHPDEVLTDLG